MKSSLLILLLFCLLCCKDNNPVNEQTLCGVKDPVRNLPWLRDLVDESIRNKTAEHLTVAVVRIGEETLINFTYIYMSCIGCVSYHCDGSRMDWSKYTQEQLEKYQNDIFKEDGKKVILWPEK
jgi:hypothetical protein